MVGISYKRQFDIKCAQNRLHLHHPGPVENSFYFSELENVEAGETVMHCH